MGTRGYGIVLLDGQAACFAAFETGMRLKAELQTRRWDPGQRCWVIASREIPKAWQIIKQAHPEAKIVDEDGVVQPEPEAPKTQKSWWEEEFDRRIRDRQRQEQQQKSRPKANAGRPGSSWAELMFASVPDELHSDLFKALLHVLHPDKGGDAEATRVLLEARERRRGAA